MFLQVFLAPPLPTSIRLRGAKNKNCEFPPGSLVSSVLNIRIVELKRVTLKVLQIDLIGESLGFYTWRAKTAAQPQVRWDSWGKCHFCCGELQSC